MKMKYFLIIVFFVASYSHVEAVVVKKKDSILEKTAFEKYKIAITTSDAYKKEYAFEEAVKYVKLAIVFANQLSDVEKGESCFQYASLLKHQGNLYLASSFFFKTINYLEDDNPKYIASYFQLAKIFTIIEQHDKALDYYTKAIFYADNIDAKIKSAQIRANRVWTYIYLDDYKTVFRELEELSVLDKELLAASPDRIVNEIEYCIATGYSRYSIHKNKYKESIAYLNSIKKQKRPTYSSGLDYFKGISYFGIKDYGKSSYYLHRSLKVYKKVNYPVGVSDCYEQLYLLYDKISEVDSAYYYLKKFQDLKKKNLDESILTKTKFVNAKFESEEKDKQIAQKNLKIEKEKYTNIVLLGVGLFLLVLLIVVLLYFRQKQKIKNQEIEKLKFANKVAKLDAIIEGEEKERTRIAESLHEDINGDLAAIKYKMSVIDVSGLGDKEINDLQGLIKVLDRSIVKVRLASYSLVPSSLQKFNIIEAVKQYCNRFSEAFTVVFQFYGDIPSFSTKHETIIYRITQELIDNIVKHSGGATILVQIINNKENFAITVEDDGVGYDVKKVETGIGLQNIKIRLELLKEDFNIEYDVESGKQGTTVTFSVEY